MGKNQSYDCNEKNEPMIIYEAINCEYEHSVSRSDKLDNKVYIMLTVCAFLFVMLSEIIGKISLLPFPKTRVQLVLEISYAILLFVCIVTFLVLMFLLMRLLRAVNLYRYRTGELLENDIAAMESISAVTFVGARLEYSTRKNEEILEKRFVIFNICTALVVVVIVTMLALAILSQFL